MLFYLTQDADARNGAGLPARAAHLGRGQSAHTRRNDEAARQLFLVASGA